jgi:hypothetical protein
MSNPFDSSQIWRVKEDFYTCFTLNQSKNKNDVLKVVNIQDVYAEERVLMDKYGSEEYERMKLPIGFLSPIVRLYSSNFAPDYFSHGVFSFCSKRLRDVLAQSPDVIDYVPIELRTKSAKAIAQDYHWMRIIAFQPGLDLQRSRYDTFEFCDPETETVDSMIQGIEKLVLEEGFQPKTEFFNLAERTLCWLALDSLADRVLRANCTGFEFRHLESPESNLSNAPITIRTKCGFRQRE